MPIISIVVPVYNAEQYLEYCIQSIIKQTVKDWQLILVDDGSTDKSLSICKKYATSDQRIICLSKKNEGVSIARKTGCNIATGNYIMFVDSDDWIENKLVERLLYIIQKYKPDIINFGLIQENSDKTVTSISCKNIGYYDKKKIIDEIFPKLIQAPNADYFTPSMCQFVFLISKLKPYMIEDSRAKVGEDGACVIPSVYHANSIYFMNENLYHYRYNSTSMTKGHNVFLWDNPEVIAKHIEKNTNMDEYDFCEQMYRKVSHDVFNVCITQFYKKKNYYAIRKEILNSLKREYYDIAIKNAHFKGSYKAIIMHIALKYRLIFLMYLFSRIK